MESAISIGRLISEACLNPEKLPEALICGGLLEAMVASELLISKAPEGILIYNGMVLFFLYYIFLIASVILGFFKIFAGFWVLDDLGGRRAAGMKLLQYSIVPLVFLMAAYGAFTSAK
ncbi:hypothetical protein ACQ4PT_049495 [Festuca glaucescens]